jgi:four helix bundle protein
VEHWGRLKRRAKSIEQRVESIEQRVLKAKNHSRTMKDYNKLEIWQRAMDYAVEIYKLSACLPPEEKYGLASQIRRAVCSISMNIAEGSGCESQKEFKLFLEYAHRSTHEVLTALELIKRLKLCEDKTIPDLLQMGKELRAMIHAFMKRL